MFHFQAILGDEFVRSRDPERARSLNPELLSLDAWLQPTRLACRLPDKVVTNSDWVCLNCALMRLISRSASVAST